jgi:nicotinic acetylcholine receptor
METNSEWEFVEVKESRNVKTYSCCAEPYIDITYNLTLRRRSPTYSAIVITPATGTYYSNFFHHLPARVYFLCNN